MAVRAKGNPIPQYSVISRDLLNAEHPLNRMFREWCGAKPATKRQAARFLQQYPNYRFGS